MLLDRDAAARGMVRIRRDSRHWGMGFIVELRPSSSGLRATTEEYLLITFFRCVPPLSIYELGLDPPARAIDWEVLPSPQELGLDGTRAHVRPVTDESRELTTSVIGYEPFLGLAILSFWEEDPASIGSIHRSVADGVVRPLVVDITSPPAGRRFANVRTCDGAWCEGCVSGAMLQMDPKVGRPPQGTWGAPVCDDEGRVMGLVGCDIEYRDCCQCVILADVLPGWITRRLHASESSQG